MFGQSLLVARKEGINHSFPFFLIINSVACWRPCLSVDAISITLIRHCVFLFLFLFPFFFLEMKLSCTWLVVAASAAVAAVGMGMNKEAVLGGGGGIPVARSPQESRHQRVAWAPRPPQKVIQVHPPVLVPSQSSSPQLGACGDDAAMLLMKHSFGFSYGKPFVGQ